MEPLKQKIKKEEIGKGHHIWEKQNLVTLSDERGGYDEMKCEKCSAIIKRRGLQEPPTFGCRIVALSERS